MLPLLPSTRSANPARPPPSHARTSSVPHPGAGLLPPLPAPSPAPLRASTRGAHTRHRRAQTLSPDTLSWLSPPSTAPSSCNALLDVSAAGRFNRVSDDACGATCPNKGAAPQAPLPACPPRRRHMHSRTQSRSCIAFPLDLPHAPQGRPPPVIPSASPPRPNASGAVRPPTVTAASPIRLSERHDWTFPQRQVRWHPDPCHAC